MGVDKEDIIFSLGLTVQVDIHELRSFENRGNQ